MTEANQAYEEGDESRLMAILEAWDYSPESVHGDGAGADLVRIIRKIAQIKEQIQRMTAEIETLRRSDIYELREKASGASADGRDLLAELAANIEREIASRRKVLLELQTEALL